MLVLLLGWESGTKLCSVSHKISGGFKSLKNNSVTIFLGQLKVKSHFKSTIPRDCSSSFPAKTISTAFGSGMFCHKSKTTKEKHFSFNEIA